MSRWLILLAGLLPLSAWADAARDTRILHYQARDLGAAEGVSSARLSLLRWQPDTGFVPIPFQIDPIGEADMVWFAESGLDADGDPERFTGADRLLFRARDLGGRAPADAVPAKGALLVELVLDDDAAQPGYLYLAQDDPRRHPGRYVDHDIDTGITRTASYRLDVDPDNELNWRYLGYHTYEGEGSIIDTLKMRMSGGFMSRRARMTLDNTNLRPRLAGHRNGPLRSVMHLETRVVLGGIPVMRLHVQAHRYPDHYEAHSYARVPGLYRSTLRDPEVSVSIDGNAQYGAVVRTARSGSLSGLVDGRMDDEERALVERGLTTDESWILFDSQQGFALLADLVVPPALSDIPLGLVYQDDAHLEVKPEQFPGQLPNLGYALRGWPPEQELRFAVRLLFDRSLADGTHPAEYAAARTRVPTLVVNDRRAISDRRESAATPPHH
ncbi:hypothetical protein [Isoalcanivorax indicus]|uniref:hypothetical protein n=1 Tax=Isoalcanivorax indicus TaxID=2202653 RepID=UPI000DB9C0BE|nr:hypothetical protein [Isoalcanivorax indicus]